jgi:hypothetical protein
MRHWVFLAVLTLLIADASGLSAFVEPETCGTSATDRGSDDACPGFCVRCACCAGPVVHAVAHALTSFVPPVTRVPRLAEARPSSGIGPEILHVPKAFLA